MTAPGARLYLFTPPIADAEAFAPKLEAALATGAVACVLVRFASGRAGEVVGPARRLAQAAQNAGATLLVENDARLALSSNADGVHVTEGPATLDAVLQALRPLKIVGAGAIGSRDAAMAAGEAGADYVMFGEPDIAGRTSPFERTLELAGWWAQLFTTPCVAYARTTGEARALAEAQVEFIAIDTLCWDDPRGPRAALSDLAALLEAHPLPVA
jgi:thiamine-phosphate pyrophosphorylase